MGTFLRHSVEHREGKWYWNWGHLNKTAEELCVVRIKIFFYIGDDGLMKGMFSSVQCLATATSHDLELTLFLFAACLQ